MTLINTVNINTMVGALFLIPKCSKECEQKKTNMITNLTMQKVEYKVEYKCTFYKYAHTIPFSSLASVSIQVI